MTLEERVAEMELECDKTGYARVVKTFDEDGKLISYQLVTTSKSSVYLTLLDKLVEENKKARAEKEEQAKKVKFYNLKNLIEVVNYAVPRGYLDSDHRAVLNNIIEETMKIDNDYTKALAIESLLALEGFENFAALYNGIMKEED